MPVGSYERPRERPRTRVPNALRDDLYGEIIASKQPCRDAQPRFLHKIDRALAERPREMV